MIKASNIVLSYSDLLKKTTQENIMSYYLKLPIDLNRLYISPLRKDRHPTCSFYYTPSGMLKLHDFGTGEQFNAVEVVMKAYDTNYGKALKIIQKDLSSIEEGDVKVRPKEDITIYYSTSPIKEYTSYWDRYKISLNTLNKFKVEYGNRVYRNEKLYLKATKDNPVFIYNFPSGKIKIYRPLSKDKKKKWYGNSDVKDIGGYMQLNPTGSVCLITSSLKDVMMLHELGIPAVCLNGESYGVGAASKKVLSNLVFDLSKRFRYIFFFLDNDDQGMKMNATLSRLHHLSFLFIPLRYPTKDISDFVEKFGKRKAWKMLKQLLKNKTSRTYAKTANLPY